MKGETIVIEAETVEAAEKIKELIEDASAEEVNKLFEDVKDKEEYVMQV